MSISKKTVLKLKALCIVLSRGNTSKYNIQKKDIKDFKITAYQGKLMGYSPIRRQLGSETQCGEHLVAVIVLYDLPHGFKCHGVGVELIGIHVMEGSGLGWVAWEPYERKCVLLVHLNRLTGKVF